MASYTIAAGQVAKHDVTLTANTVDTFTFATAGGNVQILTDGAAAAYFTLDGSTPTVAGDNTLPLPAAASLYTGNMQGKQVKIISAGTPKITVARP